MCSHGRKCSKIIKNTLFSSCVREAHVKLNISKKLTFLVFRSDSEMLVDTQKLVAPEIFYLKLNFSTHEKLLKSSTNPGAFPWSPISPSVSSFSRLSQESSLAFFLGLAHKKWSFIPPQVGPRKSPTRMLHKPPAYTLGDTFAFLNFSLCLQDPNTVLSKTLIGF